MSHLKRVRKVGSQMSMVLVLTREHSTPPSFPEHIELPAPYILSVPKTSALTMTSLKLKTSLWPTIYIPRKKYEPEPWTRGKIRWACKALRKVVSEAQLAGEAGEVETNPVHSISSSYTMTYSYPSLPTSLCRMMKRQG